MSQVYKIMKLTGRTHVYLQTPGNRIEGWPLKIEKLNLEKNNSKAELSQKAKKKKKKNWNLLY